MMRKILLCFMGFSFFLANAQDKKYEELMSQDWANLKKYRTANEKIIESGEYPEVVFMGNSITEGWAQIHPEFFNSNNFIGRGISGQTTPQMLIRFTPDVLDLNPKAVVILAGTNDIAGNTGYSSIKMITDNIKAMSQLAEENNIKVILASVLPVYDYPWRPGLEPVEKIAELNNWLKEFAEQNSYIYLDFFSKMADSRKGLPQELARDGVHPNEKGYNIMEPLTLEAIKTTLEK